MEQMEIKQVNKLIPDICKTKYKNFSEMPINYFPPFADLNCQDMRTFKYIRKIGGFEWF